MLDITNLMFRYKQKTTLFAKLALHLDAGNIYGLLGKNGAGKTTLLKLIAGLLFPTEGNCQLLGKTTKARQPETLKQLFFLAEEFYVPNVTAKEYIKLYAPFYPEFAHDMLQQAAQELEISLDENLLQLSYGQKKKFMLAFGVATNCKLLLLDEPTNGLDIPSKSQFRKLLATALTPERAFIIATHQVRDLEHILDTAVILDEGRIIYKKEILDNNINLETLFCQVLDQQSKPGRK